MKIISMEYLRFFKSFKTNKPILSNKDLNALMLLLEKDDDINTAFEIIEDPSNLEVLNKIKQHLNNGEVLESFICDYLNLKTVYYLKLTLLNTPI